MLIPLALSLLALMSNADEPALRILTYNIHHAEGTDGTIDLERIARIIRATNPDVVCLQEVDRNLPRTNHIDMPARFAELLGMTAVFEPNYRFDGGEYGNATLTNLPIKLQANHVLPGPVGAEPRGCLQIDVEFDGDTIAIFNTHWGLQPDERIDQARATRQLLEAHTHVVLAGDLNATPESRPLATVADRLHDTTPTTNVNPSQLFTVRGRRIDYVLATPTLRPESAEVIRSEAAQVASDHLPLVVVFRMPAYTQ